MKVHNIKIREQYYERIVLGQKSFEVRKNDRDYQVNDCLMFEVINPTNNESIPASDLYKIGYIHSGLGMAEGYVVLEISKVER